MVTFLRHGTLFQLKLSYFNLHLHIGMFIQRLSGLSMVFGRNSDGLLMDMRTLVNNTINDHRQKTRRDIDIFDENYLKLLKKLKMDDSLINI